MSGISCDLCGEEDAVMLQTGVADGSVIAVGGACVFAFYVGAATGLTEAMPVPVAAAYAETVHNLVDAWATAAAMVADDATKPAQRREPKLAPKGDGGGGQTGEGVPGARLSGRKVVSP